MTLKKKKMKNILPQVFTWVNKMISGKLAITCKTHCYKSVHKLSALWLANSKVPLTPTKLQRICKSAVYCYLLKKGKYMSDYVLIWHFAGSYFNYTKPL